FVEAGRVIGRRGGTTGSGPSGAEGLALTICLADSRLRRRRGRGKGRALDSSVSSSPVLGREFLGSRSGTALGDGWVRSACIICLNRCGILAHVTEDGTVDKILGDPDNPHNHGKTCAKG